ncbi:MAG: ATP synthase F0 subunit B [Geobacter sp.]|nr:ATP synthase F0 subunit B [Geobacter sp.]
MINLDLAFVVQIINFGLLVLVLNMLLFKPVRALLAQRRQEIQSARERALAVDEQVESKVAQYEARLREAKAEVAARRAELLKEAQAEESGVMDRARQDAAVSLASLRDRVAKESAEARALLQKQAEALSGDICEKLLGRSL